MKIALLGKMRSGKNTVGDYLSDHHKCIQFAFGDEVKEVINTYFPKAFENGKPRGQVTSISILSSHLIPIGSDYQQNSVFIS